MLKCFDVTDTPAISASHKLHTRAVIQRLHVTHFAPHWLRMEMNTLFGFFCLLFSSSRWNSSLTRSPTAQHRVIHLSRPFDSAWAQRYFIIIQLEMKLKHETLRNGRKVFCGPEQANNNCSRVARLDNDSLWRVQLCQQFRRRRHENVVTRRKRICQKPVKTIREVLVAWLLTKQKKRFFRASTSHEVTQEIAHEGKPTWRAYLITIHPKSSLWAYANRSRASDECQCQSWNPFKQCDAMSHRKTPRLASSYNT